MPTELPTIDEPRAERCETCLFNHFHVEPDYLAMHGNPLGMTVHLSRLECHLRGPVRDEHGAGSWPAVIPDDWCGEWKAKDKAAWAASIEGE